MNREEILATESGRRSVVLVILDAMRLDYTSLAGYYRDTTPNLKALGRDGLFLAQHYTCTHSTTPALVSMLTGLFVEDTRWAGLMSSRYLDLPTVCGKLHEQGYHTFALSRALALQYAFQHFTMAGGPTRDSIESFIATLTPPFFALIHLWNCHTPYSLDEPGYNPIEAWCQPSGERIEKVLRTQINPGHIGAMLRRCPDRGYLIGLYQSAMHYTDEMLGLILSRLPSNTSGIVLADHGEHIFEHEIWEHAVGLYQPVLRVPAVVFGSNVKGVHNGITQHPDVARWIMELAAGTDLTVPSHNYAICSGNSWRPERCIIKGRWKYVWIEGVELLYDLKEDPEETRPVDNEKGKQEFRDLLEVRLKYLPWPDPLKQPGPVMPLEYVEL